MLGYSTAIGARLLCRSKGVTKDESALVNDEE